MRPEVAIMDLHPKRSLAGGVDQSCRCTHAYAPPVDGSQSKWVGHWVVHAPHAESVDGLVSHPLPGSPSQSRYRLPLVPNGAHDVYPHALSGEQTAPTAFAGWHEDPQAPQFERLKGVSQPFARLPSQSR
jgi:hypothetical protein